MTQQPLFEKHDENNMHLNSRRRTIWRLCVYGFCVFSALLGSTWLIHQSTLYKSYVPWQPSLGKNIYICHSSRVAFIVQGFVTVSFDNKNLFPQCVFRLPKDGTSLTLKEQNHFNKTLDFQWDVTIYFLRQNKRNVLRLRSLRSKATQILLISKSHG